MHRSHSVRRFTTAAAIAGLATIFCARAHAQQPSAAPGGSGGPPPGWQSELSASYAWQAESGLDLGGEMQLDMRNLQFGGMRFFDGGNRIGYSFSYSKWDYDFSPDAAVAWDSVETLSLSVPAQWRISRDWRLFAAPSVSAQYESSASVSDGWTAGGIVGAIYQASPKLSIGPGLGAFGKLEDDASLFPIVLIKWRISDAWTLETGRSMGATGRPGLFATYQPDARWRLQGGLGIESLDFRLSDEHAVSAGAGEDRSTALFIASRYDLSSKIALTFGFGYKLNGSLKLWNSDGLEIISSDYDDAFSAGFSFDLKL